MLKLKQYDYCNIGSFFYSKNIILPYYKANNALFDRWNF